MDEHNRHRRNDEVQKPPEHGEKSYDRIDSKRDEEYAAEMMAEDFSQEKDNTTEQPVTIYGWIALTLSALSFFMMPIVLGAAGIIVGFVSRSRGADTLGNIAIGAGAISILLSVFVLPFI